MTKMKTGAWTQGNVHISVKLLLRKATQLGFLLSLTLAIAAAVFITYQHAMALRQLPPLSFSPRPLSLPLSPEELSKSGPRWVEIMAAPPVQKSAFHGRYYATSESPGTLILQFKKDPELKASTAEAQRKFRGVLYTAVNRSRPGLSPDPLIRALNQSGISPPARFAVLMVNESPWFIWKLVIKEIGVLVSGVLLLLALLLQSVRALRALFAPKPADSKCANQSRATEAIGGIWIQRQGPALVLLTSATAISWAIYLSLNARPVLPVATIFGLGASAGLGLIIMLQRYLSNPKLKKGETSC